MRDRLSREGSLCESVSVQGVVSGKIIVKNVTEKEPNLRDSRRVGFD
jgi:hypothetical protein